MRCCQKWEVHRSQNKLGAKISILRHEASPGRQSPCQEIWKPYKLMENCIWSTSLLGRPTKKQAAFPVKIQPHLAMAQPCCFPIRVGTSKDTQMFNFTIWSMLSLPPESNCSNIILPVCYAHYMLQFRGTYWVIANLIKASVESSNRGISPALVSSMQWWWDPRSLILLIDGCQWMEQLLWQGSTHNSPPKSCGWVESKSEKIKGTTCKRNCTSCCWQPIISHLWTRCCQGQSIWFSWGIPKHQLIGQELEMQLLCNKSIKSHAVWPFQRVHQCSLDEEVCWLC